MTAGINLLCSLLSDTTPTIHHNTNTMSTTTTTEPITVPAGEYYLSDPCYIIRDSKDWLDVCHQLSNQDGVKYAIMKTYSVTVKGHTCVMMNTYHGDGEYRSNYGHRLPVDSGMIGLIPVEFAEDKDKEFAKVKFDTPIQPFSSDGTMYFGKITIQTNWEEDDI